MPIQLLPISLANQIAAGEVIERPASVVKELVENCLDAGATQISVDIEQGGRRRIRVRDNGGGIVKDELGLALSRHATSKISSLSDLEAIQSLGFRGEALASISSVSRLTLTSKTADHEQAWQAWVEGRDMQAELAPASHPQGTTVDVQDLFFNTPARRKFLRTDKTEFGHIDEIIRRIALARFDVRFSLLHNEKMVRQYSAVSQPEDYEKRLAQICGNNFTANAIAVDEQTGPIRLWGWIAPAHECRHQGDVQYFYVNGRMMRDRLLAHALRQAYGDTLSDERTPTFVLYLELPAQDVDVNVHPAKHEVRFHQARQIHDFVLQCTRQALTQARAAASSSAPAAMPPASQHGYTPSSATLTEQVRELQPRHRDIFPTRSAVSPPDPQQSTTVAPVSVLRVVQQRFALIASNETLHLLNLQQVQHAFIRQQLTTQKSVGLAGQPLLIPVQLNDPNLVKSLASIAPQTLAQLGVQVEFSKHAATILQVPSALRNTDIATSMMALLKHIENESELMSWLALQQVQAEYSLAQAEHWLRYWQEEFEATRAWLLTVELPQLPEPLK